MDLKQMRKRSGLTQIQAAKAVGVHWATLADWERGLYRPKGELWEAIMAAYGAERAELLEAVERIVGDGRNV